MEISVPLGLSFVLIAIIINTDSKTLVLSIALSVILSYKVLSRQRRGMLPPGPRAWPIVGNIPQFPESKEWETYDKWAKEYGRRF
jgi:hypothetical protein